MEGLLEQLVTELFNTISLEVFGVIVLFAGWVCLLIAVRMIADFVRSNRFYDALWATLSLSVGVAGISVGLFLIVLSRLFADAVQHQFQQGLEILF